MNAREIYLTDVTLEEAMRLWLQRLELRGALQPLPAEMITVEDALHRVTAAPVYAARSVPHYHAAAMDGIAVRADLTFGASETSPVRLRPGQFVPVNTGDPLPEGCDAVVMVEDVSEGAAGDAEIIASVVPWQHVRPVGEDMVQTELLLPTHHLIRPADIGVMLAAGVETVAVRRKPRVCIIPTGDELVEPDHAPASGEIVEVNSRVLAAMASEWGAIAARHGPVPDDPQALEQAIREGVAHDIVVINAGASAGTKDHTATVIAKLGEVVLHGVSIKPGRPTILGLVGSAPVLGIPGYPVTAMLTFDLFVRPLVYRALGLPVPRREVVRAVLGRKTTSVMGVDEFIRVKLGQVGDRLIATPLGRGAGLISTMARADGWIIIPRTSEGLEAGKEVEVELFESSDEIGRTVVVAGSHDVALDVLADFLRLRRPTVTLSSAHVGSLGGLMALRRGEAHLAGSHLLDEETGEYNIPYVRRYLPDTPAAVVTLAHRDQGLMVRRGNPKRISRLEDLLRDDVRFVNRQRGAGTRLLLDSLCKQAGIDTTQIHGYDRELYTHMAVAVAVASGAADVGLGIYAAARALDLDFVPLAKERYDLVIPAAYLNLAPVQQVLEALSAAEFQESVKRLGGYDTAQTGHQILLEPAIVIR